MLEQSIELHFEPGPRLSEKVILFHGKDMIGYALRRQYVNIYKHRYSYLDSRSGSLRDIYYSIKDFIAVSNYDQEMQSADMFYNEELYKIHRNYSSYRGVKGNVMLSKNGELIGGIHISGSGFLSGRNNRGTIKVLKYKDKKELGIFLAAMFIGKDVFELHND